MAAEYVARSAGAEASRHGPAGPPVLTGLAGHSTAAAQRTIQDFPRAVSRTLPFAPFKVRYRLRKPSGGNFNENRLGIIDPRRLRSPIPCFDDGFRPPGGAHFRRLIHPLAIPVGSSLQGLSPHARLHGRLAHSTRPVAGHRHGLRGFGSGCRYEFPSAKLFCWSSQNVPAGFLSANFFHHAGLHQRTEQIHGPLARDLEHRPNLSWPH